MKVIVFEDKDAIALLDKLNLATFDHYCNNYDVPPATKKFMVDEIHRRFHYIVCTWLQDQGAKVT